MIEAKQAVFDRFMKRLADDYDTAKARNMETKPAPASDCRPYTRELDLPKFNIAGMTQDVIVDTSKGGTLSIIGMLSKALHSERVRGKAGHWTYSLSRHKALKDALEAEKSRLKEIKKSENI